MLKGFVPALIVKRAGRGTEHLAEILGVGPDLVAVDGLLVSPYFDDGEVVGPRLLLVDVESQVAVVLAGRISQSLQGRDAVILLGRDDVDMGDGDSGAARNSGAVLGT